MKLSLLDKIRLYRLFTNTDMLAKLNSRKLWAAVAGSAIAIVGNHLGVPDNIIQMVAGIVVSYIIGQAVVDTATATKK